MPWVLPNPTCAVLWVIRLVVACGNCKFVNDRLLGVNFFGDVFWVGEDVIIFIYNAV